MKNRHLYDQDALTSRLVATIEQNACTDSDLRAAIDTALTRFFNRHEQRIEDREITILLSDLRGFTALTEQYKTVEVITMLNHYFSRMNAVIAKYGGLIDKYMGDSIMVLFGVTEPRKNDELNAIACAVEMQIVMDDVNMDNAKVGLPNLYMGIGINTGRVSAGLLGSDLHCEYTVIGDSVNLTSRIESFCLRGQVLASEYTYERVKDSVEIGDVNRVRVKGKAEPVKLYEILAAHWPAKISLPNREIRSSIRVEVDTPFRFQVLSGKKVLPGFYTGQIKDISYDGIFAVMDTELEALSDINLSMAFSIFGGETKDIYAKIRNIRRIGKEFGCGIEFTALDETSQATIKDYVDRLLEKA